MSQIPLRLFQRIFGPGDTNHPSLAENYAGRNDRQVLLALCRSFRPRRVVEFGIQRGATAALLLDSCPWIERYTGYDVPAGFPTVLPGQAPEVPDPGKAGELAAHDSRLTVTILPNGTADLPLVPGPDGWADFVFVDADHSAEGVSRDTLHARIMASRDAVICWHDYTNPTCQVTGVIDQLNLAEGDHICHVLGTWVAFELRGAWR